MRNINLGKAAIPLDQYASQGNAILGIRGSGKSYTGTYIAERLLDAGVPIVAFDPIGIWRYLRVGAGPKVEGYKVVVAGGEHGDIPLTPTGAAEIMRAAMRDGISIVFDLYDIALSKEDWRRVVEAAVKVLLYENKPHGLRHIFLEEAAEFCPQRIPAGDNATAKVYGAIERLARMGGNAQLGYTLINQRAEEVNKAVLELCDLLILHRQKGRNSLTALGKWLDVAMAKGSVAAEVPALENGEAFVWATGDTPPVKTRIPTKRTFHPDRRAAKEAVAAEAKRIDVTGFVATMRESLATLAKEAEANDPKLLRARIAQLEREARKPAPAAPVIDHEAIAQAGEDGYRRGRHEALQEASDAVRALADAAPKPRPAPAPRALAPRAAPQPRAAAPREPREGGMERAHRAFLIALAQQARELTRNQVAIFAGYSATSRHVDNTLAALRSQGFVVGGRDAIAITPEGLAALGPYDPLPVGEALRDYWMRELDKAAAEFLRVICEAHPQSLTRDEIAERAGYSPTSRHVDNTLAQLRSRDLVSGGRAAISASPDLF